MDGERNFCDGGEEAEGSCCDGEWFSHTAVRFRLKRAALSTFVREVEHLDYTLNMHSLGCGVKKVKIWLHWGVKTLARLVHLAV